MQKSKARKAISAVQIVLVVLVAAGLAWIAFKAFSYNQSQQIYQQMERAYASELRGEGETMDFTVLQYEYPDVVGWLKMDDVDISYPIVQGKDNDYYLHHDPSGADNQAGSVFLDYRNNSIEDDLHVILYAHNLLDESMFGQLDNYTDEGFYERGMDSFTIYTPKGAYRYQIFAVDIVSPTDDAYQVGFENTRVFDGYVKQLEEKSMYETGVNVSGSDHVVTLSTCSDNNRLVVSAKRL